jgi:adenylate kinase family enzyme
MLKISDRDFLLPNNVSIYIKNPNKSIVPDELVLNLVKERLSKPDCKINGWILDGCP